MLVLVRHGRTVPDASVPSSEWPVVDVEPCRRLSSVLPALPVFSSPERKARDTAGAFAESFAVDGGLAEVQRPWTDDPEEFWSCCSRYLAGHEVDGWEPQTAALSRFRAAARGVVVSHGTVMSLYVGALGLAEPTSFQRQLTMPDAWLIDESGLRRLLP